LKDIIDETETILTTETLRDFDKKRIDENKAALTYEVTKVISPLKRTVPDFNTHLKNFRDFQRNSIKKRDEETQRKLKDNIIPLLESCSSIKENMNIDAKTLNTSACDRLADTYQHLQNFEPITQKMYDMFGNSCQHGTSFRTCDTVEYLHYTILEKEKKDGIKSNLKIHTNIADFLKNRLNYFENKCKNEKDGFACEQMVSYSGLEGQAQLDYAKKSCEYGNKTGCELLGEVLMTTNKEKDALVYYKKACDLGEGRACVSTIMMMMQNQKKHEKEIVEYGKKTIATKFCLPSVNPQFFVATTPEEAHKNFKQGCDLCNDATACFSYATLHLDQLAEKNPNEARKFEEEEVPRILLKACGQASLLSNPFLIEPCLSVYLQSINAFPTNA
jgi:TPR repeat protein